MQIADVFLKRLGMHPDDVDLPSCCAAFMQEMRRGLAGEESSLMMLPTYISLTDRLTAGKPVAILDAGGTNLRVGLAELRENGFVFSRMETGPVPGSEQPVSRAQLVAALADRLEPLMDRADRFGFCFSFPSEATEDLDGVVIEFNKEVVVRDAAGMHICREICAELSRRGSPGVRYALINDTVATLLGGYGMSLGRAYDGYIGFVLGTGTNCSYVERTDRIPKLGNISAENMVINMEAGGYGRFPRGELDRRLDAASVNPGDHLYEKMVSGGYLGTLAAETLREASAAGLLHLTAETLLDAVDMKAVSEYLADPAADTPLMRMAASETDADLIFALLDLLLDRAAKLVAVNLIAILEYADLGKNAEHPACIIAEGSTFEKSVVYQSKIQKYLKELGGRSGRHFVLCSYDDVNLKGAGTAALMVR